MGCVADHGDCDELFDATTPAGRPAPANVLKAMANIAKYPSYPGYPANAEDPLFQLSLVRPVDPSGNIWLTNNWKRNPQQNNPGENSIVAVVGAAGPVKTPSLTRSGRLRELWCSTRSRSSNLMTPIFCPARARLQAGAD